MLVTNREQDGTARIREATLQNPEMEVHTLKKESNLMKITLISSLSALALLTIATLPQPTVANSNRTYNTSFPSPSKRVYVSYDQITEVIEKLTKSAKEAEASKVQLFFNDGATIAAGALTEKGKLTWNFTAATDSPYMVYKEAYGNDYELKLEISTEGKSVVSSQNEFGATFVAEKGKRYSVTLNNKGAETFAGMAMFKLQDGLKHPLASMLPAAKVMAKSVETSFGNGFGITPNTVTLLGMVIPPNKDYGRATSKAANWNTIATSDGKAGSIRLRVLDKNKKVLQEDNGEAVDCSCIFKNQVVEAGSIRISNPGSKPVFVLSMGLSF